MTAARPGRCVALALIDATASLAFVGGGRAERLVRLPYGAAAGQNLQLPAGGHHPPLTAEAWPEGTVLADRLLDTGERSPRR